MLPNLGMDHDFCERVATEGNVLVLDVDYRKAPEDPFPAAVQDAEDTLRWAESQGHQFDLDRVALSGFSSGGNLTLVASSTDKFCLASGGFVNWKDQRDFGQVHKTITPDWE